MPKLSIPQTLCLISLSVSSLSALPARALAPVANRHAAEAPAQSSNPAGFGPIDPTPPTGLTVDQVIAKFGARESEFATAREDYTFRQVVKIETINDDTGKPNGAYNDVTDISFDNAGKRAEHVVFAPGGELHDVMLTQNDFDDIAHRLPFILRTEDLPQYDITYIGRQKVDDLDTYVFDSVPKRYEKGKRYFQGRIWVDQKDLQIVLINGKTVPQDTRKGHEDLSPPYTTYYEEIDGVNWFPTYTHADGILHFAAQNGAMAQDAHLRYTVKYTDYKRFRAKSRIIYNGSTLPAAEQNGKPDPKANPPAPPATPDPNAVTPNSAPTTDPNAPALKHPKTPPQ